MTVVDPLAGQRQAINDRKSSLMWLDDGGSCPVAVDDVFHLRSCSIEITRIERLRHDGKKKWRAAFTRTDRVADKLWLLGKSSDYVHDPKQAVGLLEDAHDAPTLDVVDEDDRSLEHRNAGEPPEVEAVPPHEVANSRGSIDAHNRYLREIAEERIAEEAKPLEVRLLRLQQVAKVRNVDISTEVRVIEKRIEAAERKVLERAA